MRAIPVPHKTLLLRRVLIVEDDLDTREMLARFLEIAGYQVVLAANGVEALKVLRGGAVASVILLDLMMPVMDGWQFRDEQRRDPSMSHIPVVVVTAAGARGVAATVDSPFAVPHAASAIRAAMNAFDLATPRATGPIVWSLTSRVGYPPLSCV